MSVLLWWLLLITNSDNVVISIIVIINFDTDIVVTSIITYSFVQTATHLHPCSCPHRHKSSGTKACQVCKAYARDLPLGADLTLFHQGPYVQPMWQPL